MSSSLAHRFLFAALLGAAAIAAPPTVAATAGLAHVADAPTCSSANTQVWLGDGEGGGAAGRAYYPLEFSNIGKRTCSLDGYPGVAPLGSSDAQIGRPAGRNTGAHSAVTLAPGATAHALLSIADWGAICTKAVSAYGLQVYPPGQRQARQIGFPFQICAHTSVLITGPVRAGVGIPGYTYS